MKKTILLAASAISLSAFAQLPTPSGAQNTVAPTPQDKVISATAKAKDAKSHATDAKNQIQSDPMGSLNKAKSSKESASGAISDVKSMMPASK